MLRVVSFNLNGIRSAFAKGFFTWLEGSGADIACLQELKAQAAELADAMLAPEGWHGRFHFAEKKGYSGVAIYSRRRPGRVVEGTGMPEFDREGRGLRADFGRLSVVSLYLPSGSSSPARQQAKFRFMEGYAPRLAQMAAEPREYLLCGDWNIAHREIDLRNWRANRKNSGFLPEEREWLDRVFGELGWVDVFRRLDTRPGQYTWWSNRGRAREKNVGWRIDYQVATPGLAARARRAAIHTESRFSDHAPLIIDYAWPARRGAARPGSPEEPRR
ncbi:MAG: exodeoxyribonuclease III [Rhodocyclaceae bacterium]